MQLRTTLWMAVGAALVGCPSLAADWPTYLHDTSRSGVGSEQLELPLSLQWTYQTPAPPELAWGGPRAEPFEGMYMRHRVDFDNVLHVSVGGSLLFLGSSVDNKVVCIDTDAGSVRWQYLVDGPVRLVPTYADGRIYFGADDGCVYCLTAADGQLVWKVTAAPRDEMLLARGRMISRWPIRTGVLLDGDVAYFGAGVLPHENVYLFAVNRHDGSIIWCNDTISSQDAGRNPLSPQGYLLCSSERLIVPSGRSLPAAFDKLDGHELYQPSLSWRTTAGGEVGGTKAVLADDQIYASGPHHFLALTEKTGAVGFAWIDGRQLVIDDSRAYVATGQQVIGLDRHKHAAATVERQKLRLDVKELAGKRSSMGKEEYRAALDALNRQIAELSRVGILWQTECAADASLIASGKTVFAGGEGFVTAFDADTGQQRWQVEVNGKAGGLAAANRRLFVSTTSGHVYCFADPTVTAAQPANLTPDQAGQKVVQLPAPPLVDPYPRDELTDMYASAADAIVERTRIDRGYCLVLSSGQGRLAYELARRTQLQIIGIEPDAVQARAARDILDRAGLHGTRITIFPGDPADMPLSDYFANLIVSDQLLLDGQVPGVPAEIARCTKPCGGVICLAVPESAPAWRQDNLMGQLRRTVGEINLEIGGEIVESDRVISVQRGALPGAGEWSHQYGDAANTMTSQDERVRGDLGVLWYGDPGPGDMVNRHDAAAAPLSTNGRMFVQGFESIKAYDAYNGLFLWEYQNPGAIRTGVFNNEDTSNLAASQDFVFCVVDDKCTVLDAATGQVLIEHRVPASSDGVPRVWGYLAEYNGLLFGTSTVHKDLDRAQKRRGLQVGKTTEALFAVDPRTGQQRWTYQGGSIEHATIAIGGDRVFFIDSSITRDEREALLREDKAALHNLSPDETARKEAELKEMDVRLAVCLDARSGQQIWSQPVDVTDCSHVGIGGGNLMLMYHDGHVVVCGANANGHYWRQFLSGQFSQRRLVVLDAQTGETLWAKDANYRHRPIVVGDEIFAEPWAFEIHTGKEKMREHPVTGEQTVWQFSRPGHHCGPVTATPNMLFFRSGFTGYYDLYSDSGTSHFAGQRLGCWVNAIPGNGLLMVPEASAGCVCQFSLAATIVMEPRSDKSTWRIYSASGPSTPVKHLALNFGAPGDRRDTQGRLWIAYPRPNTVGRLEYVLEVPLKLAPGGGYYNENELVAVVENSEAPWVLTSGVRGLERCEIPLRGPDDGSASYSVRCHFAVLDEAQSPSPFDIKLQGNVVAEQVDVVAQAGGPRRAWVGKFDGILVQDQLLLELVPRGDQLPTLCAVEIIRE